MQNCKEIRKKVVLKGIQKGENPGNESFWDSKNAKLQGRKQKRGQKRNCCWRDQDLEDLSCIFELTCVKHFTHIGFLRLSCTKASSGPPCPAGVI